MLCYGKRIDDVGYADQKSDGNIGIRAAFGNAFGIFYAAVKEHIANQIAVAAADGLQAFADFVRFAQVFVQLLLKYRVKLVEALDVLNIAAAAKKRVLHTAHNVHRIKAEHNAAG